MFLLWLIVTVASSPALASGSGLVRGEKIQCSNEGEKVSVPIQKGNCYNCICKNGFVECEQECPSHDGCHMLIPPSPGDCCKKCKGCSHEGVERESGEEWRSLEDPCRLFTCQAGVVTETVEQCFVPCLSPLPPTRGHCCPTCPGCKVNGQEVSGGRTVRSLDDPCLRCSCVEGRTSCSKRACPVLNCPPKAVMPPRPGECCQHCNGSRELYPPPQGRCLVGADLKLSGEDFHLDPCSVCHCENGTTTCKRPSCPPLDCPPSQQVLGKGRCCPDCPKLPPYPIAPKACSTSGGKQYQEGESWELDPCKSCSCKGGQVKCVEELCLDSNRPCPPNHKLVTTPGQCCPRCVESDGVCTVFGDPHYRTFDGKFFSFQGSCKYQLAADCVNQTFSIRVTNDARGTKTSSWTKTVSFKTGGMKVNLGEKQRVKVNGERVTVPYVDPVVSVSHTDGWIYVEAAIGVKLLWDGDSFLELSVPPKYKGALCGLCGNYNSISRDDLMTRHGELVLEADLLGKSWRVGGRKACSRKQPESSPRCSKPKRYRERFCHHLSGDVFRRCHNQLNYIPYLRSCQKDMCECPSGKCYCESFTAYARECARLGVRLPYWAQQTSCQH